MAKENKLFKGELMEELLRRYFLNMGYYVARGVKYRYEENDITDIDLFLYGRSSSLQRHRINVDVKNKKTPQAFERILWANGLKTLLGFDSCIVATTDYRPVIQSFGQIHNTRILDGNFLSKLRGGEYDDRITEEELLSELSKCKSYNIYKNKDWKYIYESSKSKLLTELDYSGANSTLTVVKYFTEKSHTNKKTQELSIRALYLTISHFLIIVDFIIKDIAFLDQKEREIRLSEGFMFGNLGKGGVANIITIANEIMGGNSANTILQELNELPIDILKEFFSKNDNAKNLCHWAIGLEKMGYSKALPAPIDLDPGLKGVISVLLDYFGINRKSFFESVKWR